MREPTPAATTGPAVHVAIDATTAEFRAPAEAAVREALKPAPVTFSPAAAPTGALRLDLRLDYRNLSQSEFETIWGATTAFLFTLYPSTCRHRVYTVLATLTDAAGNSRAYEAVDSTVAWAWMFQMGNCGEIPGRGEIESVSRSLVLNVFQQMDRDHARDGIVAGAALAAQPMVTILVNRADDIVDRVARVDRPFGRWTTGTAASPATDYRVDLHYDVRQGEGSLRRAYAALLTLGVFGLCSPSDVTLTAIVTDRRAQHTRGYVFAESPRGNADFDTNECERVDETTRPEVFARLARRVFTQLEQDGVVAREPVRDSGTPLPPLVRLIAQQDEGVGILRRATILTSGMARYYFVAADGNDMTGYRPDYTLAAQLAFEGGGMKKMGAGASAGAGALFGLTGINKLCAPMTAGLRGL
ncbi:MAG: hypothetical protein OEW72_08600, partial [Gammaproteobacteria bacterium]|nr:hypothetical protein [Gammaproteobacteria bacterium]